MKKILCYFPFLLLIAACTTSSMNSSKNQNNNYKKDGSTIHPEFTVFHVNDSISELHFKINSKELLYMRPDGTNFTSNVLISYRLLPSYDSKEIADSASQRLLDMNNEAADKFLVGKINFKALATRSYFLKVTVADLNKNLEVVNTLVIEKGSDLNRQNFIVRSKKSEAPVFGNFIHPNEEYSIQYKSKIAVNIFVRYYNREFPLAPPPFATVDPKPFQFKPDSTFSIPMDANGTFTFSTAKKGFFHFQLDTSKREGLTLYNFGENFPDVKHVEDMVPPLRYITSREEYAELVNSTTKKAAIEKFWINCTGNMDRAKEVIKKYYNRVQDANSYFSSYVEGWKTDRGMLYLIYGPPTVIYRSANTETWVYGEENNINSQQYQFVKVNNPFTENDFELERSIAYKQPWYMAVDIWRQGRTYLQN